MFSIGDRERSSVYMATGLLSSETVVLVGDISRTE